MGQFKPMVKMETTEPSVELKLKKGGHVNRFAMGGNVEKEVKMVEKELKHHESEKASKAHHGLKKGGAVKPMTAGIEGPGYKHGGKIMHKADGGAIKGVRGSEPKATKMVVERMVQNKAKGGSIAPFENKPHEAKQVKSLHTKTGGLEGPGYKGGGKIMKKKDGGSIKKFESDINGFTSHKGGKKTGEIKQAPAGYKTGGMVRTSKNCNY
jgi:hypothetical protein